MAGSVTCGYTDTDWQSFNGIAPERNPKLLYVWHTRVADVIKDKARFYEMLHPEEQQAAARYRQQKHRDRYIVQHGLLRLLLGWYTGEKANVQPFAFNQNKKPYLPDNTCYFNISHTEGHLLLAIGEEELGVDIEYIKPDFNYQDIASFYFNPAETQYIAQANNPQEAFFLLWTRKEALLKASGLGIDDDLPLIPALNGKHRLPSQFKEYKWQTQSFKIGQEHIGGITFPAGEREVSFLRFTT